VADDPRSRGSSILSTLLTIAWVLTLTSLAGAGTWLYMTRGQGAERNQAIPQVTMSLNTFRDATPEAGDNPAVDAEAPVSDDTGAKGRQLAAAGLHPHPDPLLIEKSDLGPLPVIGKDGRAPWRVYSRPFSRLDTRPKVAIVVTTLGISENATKSAVEMLPGSFTFSFAPFATNLAAWIDRSRAAGHEVLIDLPMEPLDFPQSDPGPHTLLTSVPIDQNLRQLGWVLSRATGYIGVSTYMGSNLTSKPRVLSPILAEIKSRGLMLVDTREAPVDVAKNIAKEIDLAIASSNMRIDDELSVKHIDGQLARLEARARKDGAAMGVARPYPITLTRLKEWSDTLSKRGIALAPVSALPLSQNAR
jgi:polysaccharide deacetylase 2 family uncharacterized protein YibQ